MTGLQSGDTVAVALHAGPDEAFGPDAAASVVGQHFPVTGPDGAKFDGAAVACVLTPEGHLRVTVEIGERLP